MNLTVKIVFITAVIITIHSCISTPAEGVIMLMWLFLLFYGVPLYTSSIDKQLSFELRFHEGYRDILRSKCRAIMFAQSDELTLDQLKEIDWDAFQFRVQSRS